MKNINVFSKKREKDNKNCALARNGFKPYERCNYCELNVKECSGMHLNLFTLLIGFSTFMFLFIEDPFLIRLNIGFILSLIFIFGYKVTVDTDTLARTDFANKSLNEELQKHSGTLEEEIIQRTKELQHLAVHDNITGLYNRYEFEKRLLNLLKYSPNDSSQNIMCYLDLDQFKVVNDTSGHVAGDELLKQIAYLMQRNVGPNDVVSRLGGDEFGILFVGNNIKEAHAKALNILNDIKKYRFSWDDKLFVVGASIGLVPITRECCTIVDVITAADTACYDAKDQGRNCINIVKPDDKKIKQKRGEMQWLDKLTKALDKDEFVLHIQPIVPLQTDDTGVEHYEVLIRMLDDSSNIISPMAFIPAAERYGLMPKIDHWVIENVFKLYSKIRETKNISYSFSINLSGSSLSDNLLAQNILNLFKKYNIPHKDVCFEVTETATIANMEVAISFINKMKSFGCQASLDDFGSGLSSFAYLQNIKVNYLKIDGVFVSDLDTNELNRAMVKSINDVGHIMGMKTICEYVENENVAAILKEMNVDYAQGYYYSKPKPFSTLL